MMEAQLQEYRKRKAKEKASQDGWLAFFRRPKKIQSPVSGTSNDEIGRIFSNDHTDGHDRLAGSRCTDTEDSAVEYFDDVRQSIYSIENALKLLLWLLLLGTFVFLGFGGVFLILSLIVTIYFTMGTKKRRAGELSAYSVFNPNHERLQGQLTAEQFERELKYGAGGM